MVHPNLRPVIHLAMKFIAFPALRPLVSDTIVSMLALGIVLGGITQDYLDLGYAQGPAAFQAGQAPAGH